MKQNALTKRLHYLLFSMLVAVAVMTGDWLVSRKSWWVFDVPAGGRGDERAVDPAANPEAAIASEPPIPVPVAAPSKNVATQSDEGGLMEQRQTPAAHVSEPLQGRANMSVRSGEGPIAVIHSRRMLQFKDGKPQPGELERLRAAMIVVSESWDHPILIFDADGATLNTIPVVIYEDERNDVTAIVLREMNRGVAAANE